MIQGCDAVRGLCAGPGSSKSLLLLAAIGRAPLPVSTAAGAQRWAGAAPPPEQGLLFKPEKMGWGAQSSGKLPGSGAGGWGVLTCTTRGRRWPRIL